MGARLLSRITSTSAVTMKSAAAIVVAFDNTVAVPRGPNTVCDPIPPNAPAKSAALPLCNRTTMIRKKQITTCRVVIRYNMAALSITMEKGWRILRNGIDYGLGCLSEESCDSNPIRQFEAWLQDAQAADLKEPTAMVLSTVGPAGPSGRVVLLKEVTENGFVFYTNYDSRKGQEIKTNPNCALTFYWAELERQVRIEGRAEIVAREKSEKYFKSRPRASQLGALASQQSTVIASRAELEQRVRDLEAQYSEDVPMPRNWGGFSVQPQQIEFWQGRANRLHDRILYRKNGEGGWRKERLSP